MMKLEHPNLMLLKKLIGENMENKIVYSQKHVATWTWYIPSQSYYRYSKGIRLDKQIEIRWSNLLEAALTENTQLSQLLQDANEKDIQATLNTLEQLNAICNQSVPLQKINEYCSEPVTWIADQATITAYQKIRPTLLSSLLEIETKKDYLKLEFTKEDKRFFETTLVKKINLCDSLNQLMELFSKHKDSMLLKHQRHAGFAAIQSFFGRPQRSTLEINVITAFQKKALELLDDSAQEFAETDLKLLKNLFSEQNTFGVKNRALIEAFNSPTNITQTYLQCGL
jgi:hypothetical protein